MDTEGKIIFADKITYIKSNEFLLAEGNVIIKDIDGNILTVDKATYDKTNEIIETFNNTQCDFSYRNSLFKLKPIYLKIGC